MTTLGQLCFFSCVGVLNFLRLRGIMPYNTWEVIFLHIIAVDDEPLALGLLVRSIRNACPTAQISEFQSGHKALQFVESNRCDVAFLDIHMRGIDGLTLAKKIKELICEKIKSKRSYVNCVITVDRG